MEKYRGRESEKAGPEDRNEGLGNQKGKEEQPDSNESGLSDFFEVGFDALLSIFEILGD